MCLQRCDGNKTPPPARSAREAIPHPSQLLSWPIEMQRQPGEAGNCAVCSSPLWWPEAACSICALPLVAFPWPICQAHSCGLLFGAGKESPQSESSQAMSVSPNIPSSISVCALGGRSAADGTAQGASLFSVVILCTFIDSNVTTDEATASPHHKEEAQR